MNKNFLATTEEAVCILHLYLNRYPMSEQTSSDLRCIIHLLMEEITGLVPFGETYHLGNRQMLIKIRNILYHLPKHLGFIPEDFLRVYTPFLMLSKGYDMFGSSFEHAKHVLRHPDSMIAIYYRQKLSDYKFVWPIC